MISPKMSVLKEPRYFGTISTTNWYWMPRCSNATTFAEIGLMIGRIQRGNPRNLLIFLIWSSSVCLMYSVAALGRGWHPAFDPHDLHLPLWRQPFASITLLKGSSRAVDGAQTAEGPEPSTPLATIVAGRRWSALSSASQKPNSHMALQIETTTIESSCCNTCRINSCKKRTELTRRHRHF